MTSSAVERVPRADVALALAWIPFALGAALVPTEQLRWYALGVLLLSLAHQPITLSLVYADADQLAARPRLFFWTPIVLGAVIVIGLQISFMLVAAIGGLWNTEHTLMQRYGLTRIYRRKGGQSGSGRLDLALLASWLVFVLAWAVRDARTPERIEALGLGTANERSLQLLVDLRPLATALLVIAGLGALVTTATWVRRERQTGFAANPAVYLYVTATAGLFVVAIFHPVAGLLGWVGAHALEYFIIVSGSLDRRRRMQPDAETVVARATRGRLGVAGFLAVSSAVGMAIVLVAQFKASLVIYGLIFFSVGGMHIFYDGVIWKLRRPEVARALAIEVPPETVPS